MSESGSKDKEENSSKDKEEEFVFHINDEPAKNKDKVSEDIQTKLDMLTHKYVP